MISSPKCVEYILRELIVSWLAQGHLGDVRKLRPGETAGTAVMAVSNGHAAMQSESAPAAIAGTILQGPGSFGLVRLQLLKQQLTRTIACCCRTFSLLDRMHVLSICMSWRREQSAGKWHQQPA